jgi:hypothetical protein
MASSPGLCYYCKHEIGTQNIAIQTDYSDNVDCDFFMFSAPGSCFSSSTPGKMVKLLPCPRDPDEPVHAFDDSGFISNTDLSKSFSEDEIIFISPMKKTKQPNFIELNLRNSNKVPNSTDEYSDNQFSESYEEIIEKLGFSKANGFKESFLQLIELEKMSVQKQINRKRYHSDNILEYCNY